MKWLIVIVKNNHNYEGLLDILIHNSLCVKDHKLIYTLRKVIRDRNIEKKTRYSLIPYLAFFTDEIDNIEEFIERERKRVHLPKYTNLNTIVIEDRKIGLNDIKNFFDDTSILVESKILIFDLISSKDTKVINNLVNEGKLIELFQATSDHIIIGKEIVRNIVLVDRSDDYFVSSLIDIIENEKIEIFTRRKVVEILVSINRSDSKFFDTLIQLVINENVDSFLRRDIAKYLIDIQKDYHDSSKLIDIIINRTIHVDVRIYLANSFLDNISSNEVIFALIDIVENQNVNSLVFRDIINSLKKIEINNRLYNILIEIVKSKSVDVYNREQLVKFLVHLNKYDIFKEVYLLNDYLEVFIQNSDIKFLFDAYDYNHIPLSLIIQSAISHALPLYIQSNKLCTIYKNQEIQTNKEVNLGDIEIVKKEIGLLLT